MTSLIIACPTIRYELEAARKKFNCTIPVRYIPQQLHNSPPELQQYLQKMIDSITDVDRIIIAISSCGGGTAYLKANTAELIIPRTRDCVDILLSNEDSLETLKRPFDGCIFTKGWVDFSINSPDSLQNLTKTKGKAYAEDFIRNLYDGFNKFYFVDTGLGHLEDIQARMAPLVECLYGTSEIIQGYYGILKKIAKEQIDEDFLIVPKGGIVDTSGFLSSAF